MESNEDIVGLSPVDFAVELVVQLAGVVLLEDVVCGIMGNGPLYLCGLEQVQCCVRQCHERHTCFALHTFLVASLESEGQAVRNTMHTYNSSWACIILSTFIATGFVDFSKSTVAFLLVGRSLKPVRFFIPFVLYTFCCLVPSGFAFVTRHILRTSFSIRSRTSFGGSFVSNGMIRWVNTVNMAKGEAFAILETSSTSHWAIVSRLSMNE